MFPHRPPVSFSGMQQAFEEQATEAEEQMVVNFLRMQQNFFDIMQNHCGNILAAKPLVSPPSVVSPSSHVKGPPGPAASSPTTFGANYPQKCNMYEPIPLPCAKMNPAVELQLPAPIQLQLPMPVMDLEVAQKGSTTTSSGGGAPQMQLQLPMIMQQSSCSASLTEDENPSCTKMIEDCVDRQQLFAPRTAEQIQSLAKVVSGPPVQFPLVPTTSPTVLKQMKKDYPIALHDKPRFLVAADQVDAAASGEAVMKVSNFDVVSVRTAEAPENTGDAPEQHHNSRKNYRTTTSCLPVQEKNPEAVVPEMSLFCGKNPRSSTSAATSAAKLNKSSTTFTFSTSNSKPFIGPMLPKQSDISELKMEIQAAMCPVTTGIAEQVISWEVQSVLENLHMKSHGGANDNKTESLVALASSTSKELVPSPKRGAANVASGSIVLFEPQNKMKHRLHLPLDCWTRSLHQQAMKIPQQPNVNLSDLLSFRATGCPTFTYTAWTLLSGLLACQQQSRAEAASTRSPCVGERNEVTASGATTQPEQDEIEEEEEEWCVLVSEEAEEDDEAEWCVEDAEGEDDKSEDEWCVLEKKWVM
ncbi:unnamed protein product [Amoebophrya sp. A120]|nr:unnamed protein product [Amoebophrya sp. A120]|eukprot:GSA120T00017506001.1